MSELAKAFGQKVRQLRTARGLTQPQLADEAGLSEEWIRRIERGSTSPSFDTIEAIARALRADAVIPLQDRAADIHARLSAAVGGLSEKEAEWALGVIAQLRDRPSR
jgi:transcriptional regulator with XRE-family HTH domain